MEEKNIADMALENTGKTEDKVKEPVKKYLPGEYRADKFMRIIKELTTVNKKDAAGNVVKTYATWTKPENMIIFNKGINKRLTEDDLKLESIRRLIDSKTIYRVGD